MRGVLIAEDGGEVFVGELDHLGHLRVADGAPLAIERMVVASVEVHAATSELVETGRAFFGAEDEPPVGHHRRVELLVQKKGQLSDAAGLDRKSTRLNSSH